MIFAAVLVAFPLRLNIGFGFSLITVCDGSQISLSWLVSTSLLFFWPTAFPVTASNMNWSGVLLAIFLILATVQVCVFLSLC
jgi:hypothetical protein